MGFSPDRVSDWTDDGLNVNKQNSSLMTADGEVDLVKLVKELWVNKVLILLTTLLALIGSFTYAYLSKPVYEYRVAVVPPALGSIEGFNVGRRENGLDAYTVRSIYAIFSRNLLSDENKKEFFYKIYLPQAVSYTHLTLPTILRV